MFQFPAIKRLRSLGFGQRAHFTYAMPAVSWFATIYETRLFAMTFIGGLLFMTVYLA